MLCPLQAEFVGTLLLQFLASVTGTSLGYGLSYTVLREAPDWLRSSLLFCTAHRCLWQSGR